VWGPRWWAEVWWNALWWPPSEEENEGGKAPARARRKRGGVPDDYPDYTLAMDDKAVLALFATLPW